MNYKRWFRVLICLVLVCSLVINISPIRAEASSIAAAGITIEGLVAIAYAIAGGMVFTDLTVDAINAVGTDLDDNITVTVDTATISKWQRLKEYGNQIQPDPEQDPGEWHSLLKECLAGGLLSAITAWVATYVKAAKTGANIPEGYASYNGTTLPLFDFSDSEGHYVIFYVDSVCRLEYYTTQIYAKPDDTDGFGGFTYDSCTRVTYLLKDGAWTQLGVNNGSGSGGWSSATKVLWTNMDIFYEDSSSIFLPATSPVGSNGETIPILPSIYIGDLPDQIESGEKDESNLELPVIDPLRYLNSGETALDDIKSLEQQLYDGDITYEQYLEEVTVQDEPETETTPSTEPSEEPGDETTPSDDPVDDSTISDYALNLTSFFPFCIPFDIYEFLSLLSAEPEAPVFEWAIDVPQLGVSYPIVVDLTPWNGVAAIVRKFELLAFIIGLGYATREKFLRG